MNEILWEFIIFIIAVIIHELGHYLSYLALGVKPDIKITWYGAILIGENVYAKFIPIQAYLVSVSGILWGAVVLMYFNVSAEMWLVYFLVSMIDLTNIIQLLSVPKAWKNKTLIEIAELQLQQLKEKYK